ncbi:hypothetical protein MSG28_008351, partial [Choristoneura fumiferana]
RHRRRHKRIRTTSTEAPAAAAARGDAGVREETESEHLELGMAERLDEKRFQVYRQRCLCLDGSELCRGAQYHHLQIDESEMADFPRRMRDWLFNIMRDLAERRELSAHFQRMEREAEANLTRRWTNAAIWKWCDLDAHDNDRRVTPPHLTRRWTKRRHLEVCRSRTRTTTTGE